MNWRILLALLLVAVLAGCAQGGRSGQFLEVGDTAILIIDLSMLADEFAEAPFLCTQETRGLVCEFEGFQY